jgi:hypothetical protein
MMHFWHEKLFSLIVRIGKNLAGMGTIPTCFMIVLFGSEVWKSWAYFDGSAIWLVISFVAWTNVRIFFPMKSSSNILRIGECCFFQFFPWVSAFMIAMKPGLMYAGDPLRFVYFLFRFAPIGLNVISRKTLPPIVLFFFLAVLYLSSDPFIDVFRSNSLAVGFFHQGLNPYSQIYPDIYGRQFDYHPGFLYWPAALYLQIVSKVIFGDIRVILVLAWWGAVFFFPNTNCHSQALRKIWWFIPFIPFALEQAWLDPLISFAAAATLWAMKNRRWCLMAAAIGIAASVKQYGFLVGLFPIATLALDRDWKVLVRVSLTAFVLFLLVVAPFLISDPRGFFAMTITAHTSAAVRAEALNFTAFWMYLTGSPFPASAQLAFTLYGFGLGFFHLIKNRARSRLTVIAESWAIAFGFSMLFGKFAFCNYYWLLISFWILSLAFENDERLDSKKIEINALVSATATIQLATSI